MTKQVFSGSIGQVAAGDIINVGYGPTVVRGSGVAGLDRRELPGAVTRVKLRGPVTLEIVQGDTPECVVSGDDNLVGLVTTELTDGKLVVGVAGSLVAKLPLHLKLVASAIDRIKISGAGQVSYRAIDLPSVRCTLSGAGAISLSGRVGTFKARLSGAGTLDASELHATSIKVEASGAGSIYARARDSASIDISGVAKVAIFGNPAHRSVTSSGIGKVKWC